MNIDPIVGKWRALNFKLNAEMLAKPKSAARRQNLVRRPRVHHLDKFGNWSARQKELRLNEICESIPIFNENAANPLVFPDNFFRAPALAHRCAALLDLRSHLFVKLAGTQTR